MKRNKGKSRSAYGSSQPVPSLAGGKVKVDVTLNDKVESRTVVAYGTNKDGSPNPNILVPQLHEGESLARFSGGQIIVFQKIVK